MASLGVRTTWAPIPRKRGGELEVFGARIVRVLRVMGSEIRRAVLELLELEVLTDLLDSLRDNQEGIERLVAKPGRFLLIDGGSWSKNESGV